MNESIQPSFKSNEEKKVAVFAGWPYANGPRHLGHGASLVPADAVARFHRAIGDDVMMVSGTDEYGTPNVIAAEKNGVPVDEFVSSVNEVIRDDFKSLEMSFDWFTRTTTEQHKETSQDLFNKLVENNYLKKDVMLSSFDAETNQALPDRYVEGGCPTCGAHTRGDQCEECNSILDPVDLIDPRSRLTDNPVEFKETEHWFLELDKLAPKLKDWLEGHENLRPNAKASSLNQVKDLHARAITRDMDWGVPLPSEHELAGEGNKVLYVWFEAVTGYLSASIEWAKEQGDPDKWKEWWKNPSAEHVYAMGKDNVPFHTIIWPSMLMGASEKDEAPLHLPDKIASTEYLTLGEQKLSSSRNNTVFVKDLIDVAGVDPTRFYFLNNGPETRDKSFDPAELVTVNNDELLSKWGNLVQRVMTLTVKQFGDKVPEIDTGNLSEASNVLLESIHTTYDDVEVYMRSTRFSAATKKVLQLCVETNKYLAEQQPWKTVKTDPDEAKNTLYTSLTAIDNLSRLFVPFMPNSSQKVHEMLGYNDNIAGEIKQAVAIDGTHVLTGNYASTKNIWGYTEPIAGSQLRPGAHLYRKLDTDEVSKGLKDIANKRSK